MQHLKHPEVADQLHRRLRHARHHHRRHHAGRQARRGRRCSCSAASAQPADRLDFLNSTGAWASAANGVTTTGVDAIDLWIGGLAEKKMPFGGMLGSTFNFVFETQLEKLQDGDRFYYLERTAGLNFLTELENNSFAKLIMANTDATHLPGARVLDTGLHPRGRSDQAVHTAGRRRAAPTRPAAALAHAAGHPRQPRHGRPDTNYLQYTGDDHVVLGGTAGDDILISSIGDDTL